MADYIERGFALDVVKRTSGDYAAAFAEIAHAPAADVAPVVRCRECIMHGNCTTEDVFNCSGMDMDEAFCCAGKRKNGDVNGKLSMPPQLREAEGAKLWEV